MLHSKVCNIYTVFTVYCLATACGQYEIPSITTCNDTLIFNLISTERQHAIAEAISEAKQRSIEREQSLLNNVKSQTQDSGKYTSNQLLSRFFKRPSPKAVKLGLAQLTYEDMVHRAEKKISEIKQTTQPGVMRSEARAEALAKKLFHKPGCLLTSEEIARM